jgi:hypothetical protein
VECTVSTVLGVIGTETREDDSDNEPCSRTSTVILVCPSRVGRGSLSDTPLTGMAADRPDIIKREPPLTTRVD